MEHKKFKDRRPPEADNDSDSNDIIYVNPTDHDGPDFVPTFTSRDQRLKKRAIKKPTMTAEERNDQILRDAGIDTTGMSRQEKKEFVKVIMMSKDEATPNPQKLETDVVSLSDTENSTSRNQYTENRGDDDATTIPDLGSIYKNQQPFISDEQSTAHVNYLSPNDEGQDGKSRDKAQRTKILTGHSQKKVRICRQNPGNTNDNGDEDADKDKDMLQPVHVKDDEVGKQKTKRGQGKRTTTQSKSVTNERPKKQRKMEQYSHIVIDEDIPDTASDTEMMDQRKSAQKVSAAVMEDDDTQPPDSPDVFETKSPEEPKEVRVVNTPEEEDETTQEFEMNYTDVQQSKENMQTSVQDSQTTPPDDESASVQRRLAGRTPPPRVFHQIHNSVDEASTMRKGSSTKSKNPSVSHNDCDPSETKNTFNFKTLKNKMVEMAHLVQNKFAHNKSDKVAKGDSSDEPDNARKDSSSSVESDFYDVPVLRRHYRNARKVTPKYQFYAPDPGSVVSYAKVILQLIEIYSRKLTEAQARAAEIIAWGDPVKCGRHMEKTLDFAPLNRTRQNMYKEESSEEDEFVSYKPRTTMTRKLVKLKGSHSKVKDDPDFVPDFNQGDNKALYDMDTEPFGDNVEKTVNEAEVRDDNKRPISPTRRRHKQTNMEDRNTNAGADGDGWMSAEKQKNHPRIPRGQQPGGEKSAARRDDCWSENTGSRTAARPATREVRPVRRTMYIDIPANPGAVKKKEPQDAYSFSDDNNGDEFLTLKKTGANYKNRSTRSRQANLQRKLLEKSDSGCSIENIPSDDESVFVKHKGKMTGQKSPSPSSGLPSPPYLQSESSMDSLSQQSAAMINAQGELISTQVCIQRERSALKKRKPAAKTISREDTAFGIDENKKRKRMPSGHFEKQQKESTKETSSAKGSSIDSNSDKSNDSAETQDYVGRVSPSVSNKSTEELPVLREEPTLIDDMITPTDSPDNGDQTTGLEKMDSQSPNFKKGRSAKKLKLARFQSGECDAEVSFKESPDIIDLGDPEVPVWVQQHPQQIPTNTEDVRRGKRTPQYHQEHDVPKTRRQEPISLVPCPLCSVPFPLDQIEAHAAECEGSEVANTPTSAIQNHSARYEDAEDNEGLSGMPVEGAMGFFQNSPRQANSPSPQKHWTGKANEKSSKELTGETTEPAVRQTMMCYLCDEKLPVGQEYDQHIEVCLREAQQRQAEADARGYMGARHSPSGTPDKRATRSRIRDGQGSKLLGRLDQAWDQTEGYTSATEDESCTLRSIIRKKPGKENEESVGKRLSDTIETDSSGSYSDSSSSDWDQPSQPLVRTSQSQRLLHKPSHPKQSTNSQSDALPGDWSLAELANSPLKTFVPINAQENSEGFINQFEKAKNRFENRAQNKPRVQRKGTKKRRKRKKRNSTARKPAAKRRKTNNTDSAVVHIS